MVFILPRRLGLGLGTCSGFGGAGGVETLGEPAALARRGVAVDRSLGGDPVHPLHGLLQLFLRLLEIAVREGGDEGLGVLFELFLAEALTGAALEVLADALLG